MDPIVLLCSISIAIYIPLTISVNTPKITTQWVFQFDLQNQNNWDNYQIIQHDENILNGESNGCTSRIPVIFKKLCVNWNDNDGFALRFNSTANGYVDAIHDMLWYYGDYKTAKKAEKIAKAKYIDLQDKELTEIAHDKDPSIASHRRLVDGQTAAQKCYWYGDARACAHIDPSNKNLMTVSVGVDEVDDNNNNYFGAEYTDYSDYQQQDADDVDYNKYDQQQQALYNQQWANYLQQLYFQNMLQQQQNQYAANAYNEYNDLYWDYDDTDSDEDDTGTRRNGKLYVLSGAGKRLFTAHDLYMFPQFTAAPPYPEARANVLLLRYISSMLPHDIILGAEKAPSPTGTKKDEWRWQEVQSQLREFLYYNPYEPIRSMRAKIEKRLRKDQELKYLNSDVVEHSYLNARGYSVQKDTSIHTSGKPWFSKTRYSAVRYADAQTLPAGGGMSLLRSEAKVINTYIPSHFWHQQEPDPHTMAGQYNSDFGRTQTGLSVDGQALRTGGLQYHDPFFHQSYPQPEQTNEKKRINEWYETWIINIKKCDKSKSVYNPDIGMKIAKIITEGILSIVGVDPSSISRKEFIHQFLTVTKVIKALPQIFGDIDYQLRIFANENIETQLKHLVKSLPRSAIPAWL